MMTILVIRRAPHDRQPAVRRSRSVGARGRPVCSPVGAGRGPELAPERLAHRALRLITRSARDLANAGVCVSEEFARRAGAGRGMVPRPGRQDRTAEGVLRRPSVLAAGRPTLRRAPGAPTPERVTSASFSVAFPISVA